MYVLKYDPGVEAVHDSLLPEVSEALTVALADACRDPLGATMPFGMVDEKTVRMVVVSGVYAVLYVGHQARKVSVTMIGRRRV